MPARSRISDADAKVLRQMREQITAQQQQIDALLSGGGAGQPPTPPVGTGTGGNSSRPDPPELMVKVTTAVEGRGGIYAGRLFSRTDTPPPAEGGLAEAHLGTLSLTEDVQFWNLEEVGKSTHVLTEGSQTPIATGRIIGFTSETPPKAIVRGWSLNSVECTDTAGDDSDGGSSDEGDGDDGGTP